MPHHLILFAKKPILGTVKTRLATQTSPEYALQAYEKMLGKAIRTTATLATIQKYLFVTEAGEWVLPYEEQGFKIKLQEDTPDLGDRMQAAFEAIFDIDKTAFCIIIGTDIPDITQNIIQHAFYALDTADIVIGKTNDGGYYLLGMKKINRSLFELNEWSTERVFERTLEKAYQANLSVYQLPVLRDVDTLADWEHYKAYFTTKNLNDEL